MNGSFDAGSFSPGSFGEGLFGNTRRGQNSSGGLWDAMDQLREGFEQRFGGTRVGRGDVRAAVLALLAEQPMHGYQIIHEIEERTNGGWKPSPGSVYPTLQLLADEGLITSTEAGGRKTYALTETGREAAAATDGKSAPWDGVKAPDPSRQSSLAKSGMLLAQAAAQVARGGTPEQAQKATEVLDEARRKLYSILAQD